MMTIGDRIRERRKTLRMTQQDLAAAFGINRVSVTNWEAGDTTPEISKMPKLGEILQCNPDWLLTGNGPQEAPPVPNGKVGEKVKGAPVQINVYGQAVGGVDGEFEMNGNVLDVVWAPPQISEISDAYAVIVSGDSMSPRYEDGETAFIDPRRRVRKGDYVIAQVRKEEHGAPLAYIKRFERHNQNELVLSQFNPPKELVFPASQVVSVHFIALAGEA